MILADPCNEDCENYGMCYVPCAKYIVYHKLYIDFNGFKLWFSDLSVAEKNDTYGETDIETQLITINKNTLADVEHTLSHEIEHALIYDLLIKLSLTHNQANFGSCSVSEPSDTDNLLMLRAVAKNCFCCGKKLPSYGSEAFYGLWSPDEEHFLCEKCELEFLNYLPQNHCEPEVIREQFIRWLYEEKHFLWLKNHYR
jgi:hypothetical protein